MLGKNASFKDIFSVKNKLHTKLIYIPHKEGFLLISFFTFLLILGHL